MPVGDLGNIVNLPILVSSYSSHFMFSPFVSSPTPRSCVFLFSLVSSYSSQIMFFPFVSLPRSCVFLFSLVFFKSFLAFTSTEGKDTNIIMCKSNLPWRYNGSFHLCHLRLDKNKEDELVRGTLFSSFFCTEHPRKVNTTAMEEVMNNISKLLNLLNQQKYALS